MSKIAPEGIIMCMYAQCMCEWLCVNFVTAPDERAPGMVVPSLCECMGECAK